MNNSLIDAMSFLFREPRTVHKAQRCVVGFLRILDFAAHVLALADDSATSQHLMPRASSSVTMPTERLRSLRNVVAIVGLSIREMADASPSKYS
jgi:hypothetical protein